MRQRRGSGRTIIWAALAPLAIMLAAPASAHVTEASGPYLVEMGWGNEPAQAGLENSVEVVVSDAGSGAPVTVPAGAFRVEVSFSDARITLPLLPTEQPGELSAVLVPTRPGTYTFHVTGRLHGEAIDLKATCSEDTFECVGSASQVQFPVKDPSIAELAQGLARELPRAQQAADDADSARKIAIGAIAIAALALAAAVAVGVRGRRKS